MDQACSIWMDQTNSAPKTEWASQTGPRRPIPVPILGWKCGCADNAPIRARAPLVLPEPKMELNSFLSFHSTNLSLLFRPRPSKRLMPPSPPHAPLLFCSRQRKRSCQSSEPPRPRNAPGGGTGPRQGGWSRRRCARGHVGRRRPRPLGKSHNRYHRCTSRRHAVTQISLHVVVCKSLK
jgi:hypothetical protein